MNLKEIRELFVKHSGRYDLVKDTTNWEDNGADFFINEGQRLLDRKADISKSDAIIEKTLKAGQRLLKLDNCRVIEEVFLTKDNDEVVFLKKVNYLDFKEEYEGKDEPGEPEEYSDTDLRFGRANKGSAKYKGILIGPKPSKDYSISVRGKFYSLSLKEKDDYSFWTMEHPMTLVHASMYAIESFYRNTQGMSDQMVAITDAINDLNFDEVESEIQQYNKMRDSFNESGEKLRFKRG